jgi:methanogenic corrinoid protein MtbC1
MDKEQPGAGDRKFIVSLLLEFKGGKIREFCRQRIEAGVDPYAVFSELQEGLEEVGEGYEDRIYRRYFNSDLIVSGRNMKRAIDLLRPYLPFRGVDCGTVVLGTVAGDVHDIGKTIFSVTLESEGFRVIDLGVDVSNDRFVEAVREYKPDILSMSSLLTTTRPAMGEVLRDLAREGLRDNVRVIIGGHAVTEEFAKAIGADAYGSDCIDGLRKCLQFMKEKI